jgi:small-conductance mechanosensitive channel
VRAVIEAQPQTRFDRCHFLAFGDWSLQFEVVYYVTVSDYKTYADLQQTINLGILERFAALEVEIAFVSHSLHTLAADEEAALRNLVFLPIILAGRL